MGATAEPFLSGSSGSYMEAMYESWQRDPSSVHKVPFKTRRMFVIETVSKIADFFFTKE